MDVVFSVVSWMFFKSLYGLCHDVNLSLCAAMLSTTVSSIMNEWIQFWISAVHSVGKSRFHLCAHTVKQNHIRNVCNSLLETAHPHLFQTQRLCSACTWLCLQNRICDTAPAHLCLYPGHWHKGKLSLGTRATYEGEIPSDEDPQFSVECFKGRAAATWRHSRVLWF